MDGGPIGTGESFGGGHFESQQDLIKQYKNQAQSIIESQYKEYTSIA